jgi:hypothetical protein
MYYQVLDNINFSPLDLQEKISTALIKIII